MNIPIALTESAKIEAEGLEVPLLLALDLVLADGPEHGEDNDGHSDHGGGTHPHHVRDER